jgi:predicted nucleic acid-binding protein
MNSRIFLDASFWIAYRDQDDAPHPIARRIVLDLFRERTQLVTILPVICEIHAYFAREISTRQRILNDLCGNRILAVEEISQSDQEEAVELLRSRRDRSYSLCDALSFIVMRRLHLRRALSFDNHFRQFGEFEIIS